MAGPFAPVEQAPIADVRLVAEELPASAAEQGAGVVDAVGKLVGVGVEKVRQDFEDDLKSGLNDNLDAVEQGLAAVRDPSVLAQIEDAAQRGNPFFQRAKEAFLKISDGVKQGKLPSDAARLLTQAELQSAINAAPEFTDELRAEAKRALGFSPDSAVFAQRLREPSAGQKTGAQKGEEAIQKAMAETGLTRDVVVAGNQTIFRNKVDASQINTALARGELNANQAAAIADLKASDALLGMMNGIQTQMLANGGIYDAEQAKVAAATQLQALKLEALNSLDPAAGVDVRTRVSQQFDNHARTIDSMLEDGSIQNMMTKQTETTQAMILNGLMNMPELATIYTLTGKEGFADYMSLVGKYDTPQKWNVAKQVHPALSAFDSIKQFIPAMNQAVTNQANGVPAASDQERIMRGMYNTERVRSDEATSEQKVESIDAMRTDLGGASTLNTFDNGKQLVITKRDAKVRDSFANLYATQYAGNVDELSTSLGKIPNHGVTITDGELDATGLEERVFQAVGVERDQMNTALEQIDRANRMLRIGNKYTAAGVIDTSTEQFMSDVTGKIGAVPVDLTEAANAAGFAPQRDGVYVNADGKRIVVREGKVFEE